MQHSGSGQIQQKSSYHQQGIAHHSAQLADHLRRLSTSSAAALAELNIDIGTPHLSIDTCSLSSMSSGSSAPTSASTSSSSSSSSAGPFSSVSRPTLIPIKEETIDVKYISPHDSSNATTDTAHCQYISPTSQHRHSVQSDWSEVPQTPVQPFWHMNSVGSTSLSGATKTNNTENPDIPVIKTSTTQQPYYYLDWHGNGTHFKEVTPDQITYDPIPKSSNYNDYPYSYSSFGYSGSNAFSSGLGLADDKRADLAFNMRANSINGQSVDMGQSVNPQHLNLNIHQSFGSMGFGDVFMPDHNLQSDRTLPSYLSQSPNTRASSASPTSPTTSYQPSQTESQPYRRYSDTDTYLSPTTTHAEPASLKPAAGTGSGKKGRRRKSTWPGEVGAEWEGVADKKERRKLQNRLAQRAFRARTKVQQQQEESSG